MLQTLFRGNSDSGHWFCVSTVGCREGDINIFDSAYKYLDTDSMLQICAILQHSGTSIKFNNVPVQKQIGGSDCGLYAIAFATTVCLGLNPGQLLFEQDKMRAHLRTCLENGKFTIFLYKINTNWSKKKTKINKRDIFCVCRAVVCCCARNAKHGFMFDVSVSGHRIFLLQLQTWNISVMTVDHL